MYYHHTILGRSPQIYYYSDTKSLQYESIPNYLHRVLAKITTDIPCHRDCLPEAPRFHSRWPINLFSCTSTGESRQNAYCKERPKRSRLLSAFKHFGARVARCSRRYWPYASAVCSCRLEWFSRNLLRVPLARRGLLVRLALPALLDGDLPDRGPASAVAQEALDRGLTWGLPSAAPSSAE